MKIKTAEQLYMKALDKRRKQIKMLRQRGLSYTAIGTLLGITRQRAHQIGRVK